MFHCIEKTLDIKTRFYKIRLWIGQESLYQTAEELELEHFLISEIDKMLSIRPIPTIESLIPSISKLSDKINAIQVKTRSYKHKEGLMVYTVPF